MRGEIATEAGARLGYLISSVCGGGAMFGVVNQWTVALLGVPLVVVLAAVAGIGLAVSYQERAGVLRLIFTTICSLIVACSAAVFAMQYAEWTKGGGAFAAALAGLVLQIFVPVLIERRRAIVDGLLAVIEERLRGHHRSDHKGKDR